MATLFISLFTFFDKHRTLFWSGVAIVCLGIAFLACRISFEEDITRFFPVSKENSMAVKEAFANNKLKDKLVVMVNSPAEDQSNLIAFADTFAAKLRSSLSDEYLNNILFRVEENAFLDLFDELYGNLPVYLDENDFVKIDSLTQDNTIAQTMRKNYRALLAPSGLISGRFIEKDPLGIATLLMPKLQQLQLDNNYRIENGYIFSRDGKTLLIFISPAFDAGDTYKNEHFLTAVRQSAVYSEKLNKASTTLFGGALVSQANARQMKMDSILASSISTILILLLLYFFFRTKRIILFIFLPVLFGAGFSLALLYLIKSKVSIIAVGAGSVVLGLAINYSMHFFVHLKHIRDAKRTLKDLASPMTIGNITTVGAFLGLQFIQSELLRDFGLFAAFSLVGSALFTLIVLPHTARFFHSDDFGKASRLEGVIERIVAFRFRRKGLLIVSVLAATILFSWFAKDVQFEDDLMSMNYMPDNLSEAERKLDQINDAHLRSVFCLSYGNTVDEAASANAGVHEKIKKLRAEGIVSAASSVADFLVPEDLQRKRIERWSTYWNDEKKSEVKSSIQKYGEATGFAEDAFLPFHQLIEKEYKPVEMLSSPVFGKSSLMSEFVSANNNSVSVLTGIKVAEQNRDAVFEALSGMENALVFDKRFISNQLVQFLQADFSTVLYISSILVFVFLLLSFGRIEPAVFSFLPMLISWLWILGIMALFGIKFNIVNIIISTFIFGLGDDYSIFNTEGMLQEYSFGRKVVSSYKTSILLSALTCLIGVGTLVVAVHPALQSISLITIIGMLCVVFIAFYVQPLLYEFLLMNRKRNGKVPLTFLSIFQSVFAFSYFFLGCVILNVITVLIYPVLPVRGRTKKRLLHNLLTVFCASLVYIMVNVRKRIINQHRENFSKPAVVIANHQSFLDILLMVMLSNKNILLVNDWVWNSPFFGLVVRRAGFYPVSKGFEESIPALQEAVSLGYSIVVFPEGTRSTTPDIHRFHKGAFFIAERFNLDVLPVLIHGTSDTMQKGDDFLLKSGQLTVKILPRIAANDQSFGTGYYDRNKNISRYFKSEYKKLREELETPSYFRDKLIKNYIYKGSILEWYIRIKLMLENDYRLILERVPRNGIIVDLGCGYGNVSLMAGFISKDRQITGVDYDEDKIAIASNSPTRPANVHFLCSDVLNYHFNPADAYLLSDVLHYLPEHQQVAIIEKCIANLNAGGSVLIRDANADLAGRHKGTRFTEFFATTFGYNKAKHGGMHFISGKTIEKIAHDHRLHVEVIDNTRLTSNIFYHLKKQV